MQTGWDQEPAVQFYATSEQPLPCVVMENKRVHSANYVKRRKRSLHKGW